MCFFLEELGAHTVNRGVEWLENDNNMARKRLMVVKMGETSL